MTNWFVRLVQACLCVALWGATLCASADLLSRQRLDTIAELGERNNAVALKALEAFGVTLGADTPYAADLRSLNLRVNVCRSMQNLAMALRVVDEALVIANEVQSTKLKGTLYLNRGAVYTSPQRLQEDISTDGLMIPDIDHFKHINDTLGHADGDTVLVGIVEPVGPPVAVGSISAGGSDS